MPPDTTPAFQPLTGIYEPSALLLLVFDDKEAPVRKLLDDRITTLADDFRRQASASSQSAFPGTAIRITMQQHKENEGFRVRIIKPTGPIVHTNNCSLNQGACLASNRLTD